MDHTGSNIPTDQNNKQQQNRTDTHDEKLVLCSSVKSVKEFISETLKVVDETSIKEHLKNFTTVKTAQVLARSKYILLCVVASAGALTMNRA